METLAILFFVAVGAAIWYRHNQSLERKRTLAANGLRAQATILDKFTRTRPKSGKRHYVQYEFVSRDGTTHSGKHLVTAQEYEEYEIGDRFAVIYDPHAIEHNRPESYLARKGFLDRRKTHD